MKSPYALAEEIQERAKGLLTPHELMVAAIEADRAQRDPNEDGTIHGAAILALLERAENYDNAEGYDDIGRVKIAAEWIEDNPDEFWDTYAGPMLDAIEKEYGR